MAADTGGKQVICYLCEQKFNRLKTTKMYDDNSYRLCSECIEEFEAARINIEDKIVRMKKT